MNDERAAEDDGEELVNIRLNGGKSFQVPRSTLKRAEVTLGDALRRNGLDLAAQQARKNLSELDGHIGVRIPPVGPSSQQRTASAAEQTARHSQATAEGVLALIQAGRAVESRERWMLVTSVIAAVASVLAVIIGVLAIILAK